MPAEVELRPGVSRLSTRTQRIDLRRLRLDLCTGYECNE